VIHSFFCNMSDFHNDIKKVEVVISGQLLTSLIDETISINDINDIGSISCNGLLLGNREERRSQQSADNNEDTYELKHEIEITNYLNLRSSFSIW